MHGENLHIHTVIPTFTSDWLSNDALVILNVILNLLPSSPCSHTPVHGARQSSNTRHRKHLACPSLISLLWMLVLQTKSLALKLDPSVSCKKRNLDLKLWCVCVSVCFIFSSSHLSIKKSHQNISLNAISLNQSDPRAPHPTRSHSAVVTMVHFA